MTYGFLGTDGKVQLRELDVTVASPAPRVVTDDAYSKIDPYPWIFSGQDVLLAGIDGRATAHAYVRSAGAQYFAFAEAITPPASALLSPALAQSHEPLAWGGQAYSAYQVNDAGDSFWNTAFANPGEIWLTTVLQSPQQQWRLSESTDAAKAEPETYVGTDRVWVFYSSAPRGANLTTTRWALRRADTPLHLP